MVNYKLMSNVRMQYINLVPFGKTLKECLENGKLELLDAPFVVLLGKQGKLFALNISAALLVEGIYSGCNTEDIYKVLLKMFSGNIKEAEKIMHDVHDCINELVGEGLIIPVD